MEAIRRSRIAIVMGVIFLVIGIAYLTLAGPAGYHVEWAGGTILIGLGVAMGLMAYVLIAGTPRD